MKDKTIRRYREVSKPPMWMYNVANCVVGRHLLSSLSWERRFRLFRYYNSYYYTVTVELRRGSRYTTVAWLEQGKVRRRKLATRQKMPFWTACRLLWWLLWSKPCAEA